MKNKRLMLLVLAIALLSFISVNAVIFDETKASGYSYGNYYGSGGFITGIGGFYSEYGGWVDFFIFALIFGALAKKVFKDEGAADSKHSNLIVMGLAIGLSLMLVLYEETNDKHFLLDYWWIAVILLFSVFAVMLWKFWHKALEGKSIWIPVVAVIITLLLSVLLFQQLSGGSNYIGDIFGGVFGNSFGRFYLFLGIFLLVLAIANWSKLKPASWSVGSVGNVFRPRARPFAFAGRSQPMPPGNAPLPANNASDAWRAKLDAMISCYSAHFEKIRLLQAYFSRRSGGIHMAVLNSILDTRNMKLPCRVRGKNYYGVIEYIRKVLEGIFEISAVTPGLTGEQKIILKEIKTEAIRAWQAIASNNLDNTFNPAEKNKYENIAVAFHHGGTAANAMNDINNLVLDPLCLCLTTILKCFEIMTRTS